MQQHYVNVYLKYYEFIILIYFNILSACVNLEKRESDCSCNIGYYDDHTE